MSAPVCTYFDDDGGHCHRIARGRYLPGWRCEVHTPARLAGHAEASEGAAEAVRERLAGELSATITDAVLNMPRSLQVALGPSEIGHPCQRQIAYKLLDWPQANQDLDYLPSFVGTAAHVAMAAALEAANVTTPGTWLVEQRVHATDELSGSTDAYHLPTDTVVDHKFVGPSSMKKYRANGPSRIYVVQAHTYGLGWERAGRRPLNIAIALYPRGGRMRDLYVWVAPYDQQVALEALARLRTIKGAVLALDPEANPAHWSAFPIEAGHHCTFCPYYAPGSSDLSQGCPSEPGEVMPRASLEDLIV
jgi:hypothetical protein